MPDKHKSVPTSFAIDTSDDELDLPYRTLYSAKQPTQEVGSIRCGSFISRTS